MTTKPINLGALQDALKNADALVKSAQRTLDAARIKYGSAATAWENARDKHKLAVEARNEKKRAVVEGARQVVDG